MSITLPNTGVILPALGGDSGDWDDLLNDAFANYDAHDHTPGSGVQVPIAGINIDANLDLDGFALVGATRVEFDEQPAATSGGGFFYMDEGNHELYFRTSAGANIKITDDASLNLSLVGGIGGDYATIQALVAYDDADDTYTFKQEANPTLRAWARMDCADVRLHQYATTKSEYVSLQAPSTLVAPYDVVFADALPASTAIVQIDAAGGVVFSNTIPEVVEFEDVATFSGGAVVATGEDLALDGATITGDFAIDGDATFAVDKHLELSGTGVVKTGDRTYTLALATIASFMGSGSITGVLGTPGIHFAAGAIGRFAIQTQKHERLKSVSVIVAGSSAIPAALDIYTTDAVGAGAEVAATTTTATATCRRTTTITTPALLADDLNNNPRMWYGAITGHASGSDVLGVSWVVDVPGP